MKDQKMDRRCFAHMFSEKCKHCENDYNEKNIGHCDECWKKSIYALRLMNLATGNLNPYMTRQQFEDLYENVLFPCFDTEDFNTIVKGKKDEKGEYPDAMETRAFIAYS